MAEDIDESGEGRRGRWIVSGIVLLFMAVAGSIYFAQDDFARAEGMFERGEYVSAMQIYQSLAERGDARAQFAMFTIYHQGLGPNIYDPEEALRWLAMAADNGYAWAEMRLGDAYYLGDEWVEQDYTMAEHLWTLAASHGLLPEAKEKLLGLYSAGEGGAPAPLPFWGDTLFRLEQTIHDGELWPQALLGMILTSGPDEVADRVTGMELLFAAAGRGDALALDVLTDHAGGLTEAEKARLNDLIDAVRFPGRPAITAASRGLM